MSRALAITLVVINAILALFYFGLVLFFFEAVRTLFEGLYLLPLFDILFFWADFFIFIVIFYVVMSAIPIVTLIFRQLHLFSVVWLYILAAVNLCVGAIVNGVILLVVALLLMRRKEKYLGEEGKAAPLEAVAHMERNEELEQLDRQPSYESRNQSSTLTVQTAQDKIDHYLMYMIVPAIGLFLIVIDFLFSLGLTAVNFSEQEDKGEIINRLVFQFVAIFVSGAGLILFLRNQLNKAVCVLWYVAGGLLLFSSNYLTGAIMLVSAILLQLDQKKFTRQIMQMKEGDYVERSRIDHNGN